jgi:hypothetical protein
VPRLHSGGLTAYLRETHSVPWVPGSRVCVFLSHKAHSPGLLRVLAASVPLWLRVGTQMRWIAWDQVRGFRAEDQSGAELCRASGRVRRPSAVSWCAGGAARNPVCLEDCSGGGGGQKVGLWRILEGMSLLGPAWW